MPYALSTIQHSIDKRESGRFFFKLRKRINSSTLKKKKKVGSDRFTGVLGPPSVPPPPNPPPNRTLRAERVRRYSRS